MSSIVTLSAYRGFQDIGTVGQNVQQLAGNVQSINQLLDVGVGNTRDYAHMFVRVEHLIGLGLATLINTNQLESSGAGGASLTASESIVETSGNLTLVNDTATPGNDYFYGTNGSGVRGWYALASYSGTVTSVALTEGSSTPIFAISGSPVTSSGTLDFTLKTQSANYIFAGPTTGAAAQPTFRSLVSADIPALAYVTSITSSNLTVAGTSAVPTINLTAGQVTNIGLGGTALQPANVADSITTSGGNLQLVGDSATPGNSYFYGTNGSGTKGWYASTPASIGLSFVESAGWNSSNGAVQLALTVAQDILIPYACTLNQVVVLTQGTPGSCTVTIQHCTSGLLSNYPPTADVTNGNPVVTAATTQTISAATMASQTWVTSFLQNDVIRLTLTANTNFTSVKIILRMQ